MTLLSIIIPVYNAQATLERTLASLAAVAPTRRGRVQVVAVNDGSTDDSGAMLRSAAARGGGFTWRVVDQANGGLSRARNAAIEQAGGDWLFFLDADDELVFDPTEFLAGASPEVTCLGMSVEYRWRSGRRRRVTPRKVDPKMVWRVFSTENPFQPSSLLFRRDRLDHPFDPKIQVVNDWLFWMENPGVFARMELRREIISARVHIHGGNMSSQYALSGRNRAAVAQRMVLAHPDLPADVKNNFFIQSRIGRLQETGESPGAALWAFPCDPVLYAKQWVYWCASLGGMKATRFPREKSQ